MCLGMWFIYRAIEKADDEQIEEMEKERERKGITIKTWAEEKERL